MTVLLRVYCGQCTVEHRRHREELGRVVSDGAGSSSWQVYDPRRKRRDDDPRRDPSWATEAFMAGVPLKHVGISRYRPPVELFAYCKNHGRGHIMTGDVLNRSGSIVLNLIAPA